MLAELVDAVIGVDTHKHTHTAAVIDATTGAVLDQLTVDTDPDGYHALVAMADRHSGLRAWSIEGTGGYGAGLVRHLGDGEIVIELDRPNRPARRNGAKSDPLDAIRAGREALAREHLAQPRAAGERAALGVRLAARRSAVDAATTAQHQLLALIVAAPETLRGRFRGLKTSAVTTAAARLRTSTSWDLETTTTAQVLRDLARRAQRLQAEARDHEKAILATVRSWRPDLLDQQGVAVRTIFAQPDAAHVRSQHGEVTRMLRGQFPDVADMLEGAAADLLAFTGFPQSHWRKVWSTNPLERLNAEIKRRTRVVGIFPNDASVARLVTAVVVETHDEWAVAERRYLSEDSMAKLQNDPPPAAGTKEATLAITA